MFIFFSSEERQEKYHSGCHSPATDQIPAKHMHTHTHTDFMQYKPE